MAVLQEPVGGHAVLVAQVREANGYATPALHQHTSATSDRQPYEHAVPLPINEQVRVPDVVDNMLSLVDNIHSLIEARN